MLAGEWPKLWLTENEGSDGSDIYIKSVSFIYIIIFFFKLHVNIQLFVPFMSVYVIWINVFVRLVRQEHNNAIKFEFQFLVTRELIYYNIS